ncbi:MAG: hypothetical protein ACRD1L_08020 [Terriglobales bacterium]
MDLELEIQQILAVHAGEPVDYVAVFMLLNTAAGGNYQERYAEPDLRAGLRQLLAAGTIEAWGTERRLEPASVIPGETPCLFRLASRPANA